MAEELDKLRIDRRSASGNGARKGWRLPMATTLVVVIAATAGVLLYAWRATPERVEALGEPPVQPVRTARAAVPGATIILSATGYVVAAHKIELAAKVVGKVAWIGVGKGDRVREGQELVRLEDVEYRAQVEQARGQMASLKARLAELENGSRPEEVARARADLDQSRADLENTRVTLERTRTLVEERIAAQQTLDDAQGKYDGARARVASLDRAYELVRIGPRHEQIDSMRAQLQQAQGALDLALSQLADTVIHAPISGTVLERNVEIGEFVTTGFVGDRGAKGYVVSLADLQDLQVELDISQTDFARLGPRQQGIVTVDAYPDRSYRGAICEVSPEANRQKATVQVKVKIQAPDGYLRPEMNATVRFTK